MLDRIYSSIRTGTFFQRSAHYIFGKGLFALPAAMRRRLYQGQAFYCPSCGSWLKHFLALYRPYHLWCPVCKSLARHRFVSLHFEKHLFPKQGKNLRVLHVAPEAAIAEELKKLENVRYLSADLHQKEAQVKMDICDIQFPDHSFDLIFCAHVLEHVPDDRQALAEFRRVLDPEGQLILMVPIQEGKTIEDPSLRNPVERERLFGQLDHLRAYGTDFKDRLEAAGFDLGIYQPTDYTDSKGMQLMGLDAADRLFVCRKAQDGCFSR